MRKAYVRAHAVQSLYIFIQMWLRQLCCGCGFPVAHGTGYFVQPHVLRAAYNVLKPLYKMAGKLYSFLSFSSPRELRNSINLSRESKKSAAQFSITPC